MEDDLVFVVDDDASVRKALARLLSASGFRVETFATATDFVSRPANDGPCCLVLDLKMPGKTGLELQEELRAAGRLLPIVFVTGHGDIPTSVQAMRRGAVDFLTKPFEDEALLDVVRSALARDRASLEARGETRRMVERWRTLTEREREVFALVVEGCSTSRSPAGSASPRRR